MEILECRQLLTTFTVNSNLDTVNSLDGVTTLREAILAANGNSNGTTVIDNIRFDPSVQNATISVDTALPQVTEPVNIEVDPFYPYDPDVVHINRTGTFSGPGLDLKYPNRSLYVDDAHSGSAHNKLRWRRHSCSRYSQQYVIHYRVEHH